MGKSSKPLTIVALPPCSEWEELEKLEKQGHTIIRVVVPESGVNLVRVEDLNTADIILGPRAWRMDQEHRDYLPLAIKEARMLRYTHDKRMDTKIREEVTTELGLDDLAGCTRPGSIVDV